MKLGLEQHVQGVPGRGPFPALRHLPTSVQEKADIRIGAAVVLGCEIVGHCTSESVLRDSEIPSS